MTITRRGIRKGQPNRFLPGHHRRMFPGKIVDNMPEYAAYHHARDRCNDPKDNSFKNYGARGIKFLFTSFRQFYAEVGPRPSKRHSLDRIKNDGNYEPGNVRWLTKRAQLKNRRPMSKDTKEKIRKGLLRSWARKQDDIYPPWVAQLREVRMAKDKS
jgi:hypothetical protein